MIRYLLKIIQTCELMQMQIIVKFSYTSNIFQYLIVKRHEKTKGLFTPSRDYTYYQSCDYQYLLFIDYPYVQCNTLHCQYLLTLFLASQLLLSGLRHKD